MSIVELFLIAVGLSMDAFAVAICKGLTLQKMSWKGAVITGIYFGGFQGLMPVIGYFLGYGFRDIIEKAAHLIAFVLLLYIGGSMIKESTKEEREMNDSFSPREMLPLALATSIDALMTGVTFAFLNVSILPAACFIGAVTFFFSVAGLRIGNVFGARFKTYAQIAGGVILILMGIKILLVH